MGIYILGKKDSKFALYANTHKRINHDCKSQSKGLKMLKRIVEIVTTNSYNFINRVIFLIIFLTFSTYAKAGNFDLVWPVDKTVYDEPYASIVIKIDSDKIDTIKIVKNYDEIYNFNLKKNKKEYYCQSVNLDLGKNPFLIKSYFKGKLVDETNFTLFYKSLLDPGYYFAPEKFKKSFFHSNNQEKICSKCHQMDEIGEKKFAFLGSNASNCYGCHKLITSKKFTHAPTASWLCTTCHDKKDESKYSTKMPISTTCFLCHEDKNKLWKSKKFEHYPVLLGDCTKCHNPHGTEKSFFMREPIDFLCGDCHRIKLIKGHIETTYSGKIHPVKGFNDPSRKGKKLSCVSCHDPHASNHNYFLKREKSNLCLMCHKK